MWLTKATNFQFRDEFFDALNSPNLRPPNRYVNEPQFGATTMAMSQGAKLS